jgi:signal peptidase I
MSLLKRIRQDLPFAALMAGVLFFNNAIAGVMLVPSGSMEPTLQVGDYIAVNRLAYGFHLPFVSTAELARWATPKRGDVVIFNAPPAASSSESTFVKRVIGEPGDVVEVHDHHVSINGKPLQYVVSADKSLQTEIITSHRHLIQVGPSPIANMPAYRVPEDAIFVMGDHRDNSSDSRVWGPVSLTRVRGKAVGVVLNVTLKGSRFLQGL